MENADDDADPAGEQQRERHVDERHGARDRVVRGEQEADADDEDRAGDGPTDELLEIV